MAVRSSRSFEGIIASMRSVGKSLALPLQRSRAGMRIAQVAPLYEAVPPRLYGGTERVVSALTEELVRRGHDVTLFASGDSVTSARLVAVAERALRLDAASREVLAAETIRQLDLVFANARDFDLIHCHVDFLAYPFSGLVSTPTLHTVHGRLDLPYLAPVYRQFGHVPLVSISDAQRKPLAGIGVMWAGTVHHGLSPGRLAFSPEPGEYLAFLGRLAAEKQPDVAIEVARRAGLPLRIAAKIDAADREYFERVVAPLLDDPLIEFIGEIGDADKAAFLGGARALLFPIDWPEPFGLVMIEAMACGTPVIARPCGSVPEVVRPGISGFIADSVPELVDAVKRVDTLDRARCRRDFEERFSVARMVDGYEALYRRACARPRAA
jgi:glycosyltransferase involved in cell wall biosynthesis